MSDKVNMMLMTYGKYFPEESFMVVRDKLEAMDDSTTSMMYTLQFKDPMTALILSLLLGSLGVDRFYIGDVGLGVIKLLTCGGFGVWTLIDYFLIMNAAKQKNFEKFMAFV